MLVNGIEVYPTHIINVAFASAKFLAICTIGNIAKRILFFKLQHSLKDSLKDSAAYIKWSVNSIVRSRFREVDFLRHIKFNFLINYLAFSMRI